MVQETCISPDADCLVEFLDFVCERDRLEHDFLEVPVTCK